MAPQTFRTYLFSYSYEGSSWVVEIKAESPEDAQRRVARLQHAHYDGELMAKLPVPTSALSAWAALARFLRALWPASPKAG